ncbi:MAG: LL-diaminopimelate aminotransferase [Halobacteriota archaeon]|nr:LL-diaminopimelate aminotransferase [Halobacteriota archaeon]
MYSERINLLPPYLFSDIDEAKSAAIGKGIDVIDLGVGDPDLPTPTHIIDSLYEAAKNSENHRYPSYIGMLSFREAVAEWYEKTKGVSLDPKSEVLTLIGSKEGIAHAPFAFINSGDVVLVPDPAYPVYNNSTILADGIPHVMPLTSENDFKVDLEAIGPDTARKAKMMFLNYPNNPTSATADESFFKEAVDFAKDNEIIICHDNPYSEITFDGYKALSFLTIDGARDVGIEFNSLSKTYNMTGWRVGYAVGNEEILNGIGQIKTNIDSGLFQAVQEAGITALTGPQDCISKNVEVYKERRDTLVQGLKALGWDMQVPKATFYVWARVPDDEYDSIGFSKILLEEAGVVATPGVGFGKYGQGYLRFALTEPVERMKEAIERIGRL